MKLCSNRPEGFGPHSNLHPHLPTSCFQDIIVTPLASWIYLLLTIFLLLPLLVLGRKSSNFSYSDDGKDSLPKGRTIMKNLFRGLYYFLILALIAMLSLEIARLVDAELGIGLLPFLYPAYIIAAGFRAVVDFRWMRTSKGFAMAVKAVNLLFWIMLTAVFAIKVGAYSIEGLQSRDNVLPVDRYKVVDEVTDVAVMVGVALVLAVMEIFW